MWFWYGTFMFMVYIWYIQVLSSIRFIHILRIWYMPLLVPTKMLPLTLSLNDSQFTCSYLNTATYLVLNDIATYVVLLWYSYVLSLVIITHIMIQLCILSFYDTATYLVLLWYSYVFGPTMIHPLITVLLWYICITKSYYILLRLCGSEAPIFVC